MKLKLKEATTSKILKVFIQDSSATDGSGLTGLTHSSSGLTAYWIAEGDASATSITLATATVGTYTSGGFKEVDSTNMPGVYEFGIPNAAIDASSEGSVVCMLKGATNMAPVLIEIELDAIDYRDGVVPTVTTLAGHTAQTGDNYTRLGAPAGASIAADIATVDTVADGIKTKTDSLTFTNAGKVDSWIASGIVHGGTSTQVRLDASGGNPGLYITSGQANVPAAAFLENGASLSLADNGLEISTAKFTTFTVTTNGIAWNSSWDAEVQSEVADALGADANITDWADGGRLDVILDAILADTAAMGTTMDSSLASIGLDHLVSTSVTGADIADNSIVAKMVSKEATADWDDFDNTTDALQALRDNQSGSTPAAIADAVWDEARTGHTTSGTFGYYLDAQITGVGGAVGSGAVSHTVTVNSGGSPVDGAEVWITTDSAGTNVVAGTLVTNASGQATFMLDAGTYYQWAQKAGVNFTNPSSFTVSA